MSKPRLRTTMEFSAYTLRILAMAVADVIANQDELREYHRKVGLSNLTKDGEMLGFPNGATLGATLGILQARYNMLEDTEKRLDERNAPTVGADEVKRDVI